MNALLWTAPVLWPLLAAAVLPFVGRGAGRGVLLASGAVPALLLAVLGPPGPPPALPWLLLDLRLGLEPSARVLLLTTALVWLGGGIAARRLSGEGTRTAVLWLVTLAGNVGMVLAADVVSLYTLYAVMTFAAYGLVVHTGTSAARRAGRVYLTMAVLGEVLLLTGLFLSVGAAGATGTAEVAAALGAPGSSTGVRDLTVALLTAGFAVKAGVVPLHLWLPLAHPAAPVPASAVLSGAIIKAGLVGWLAVLPIGTVPLPGWSLTLVLVGVVTALAAAAVGVQQDRPKVVLAYSSISQMGLITVAVGLALSTPAAAPVAVAAAVTYALHHGVAKGALFLGVGVRSVLPGPRGRQIALAGTVLAGAALTGMPLTSGWVAKAALKDAVAALSPTALPGSTAVVLAGALNVAAVGTTLLIARLLVLLARPEAGPAPPKVADGVPADGGFGTDTDARVAGQSQAADRALVTGWGLLLVATVAAAWVLPAAWLAAVDPPRIYLASLWAATWPVVIGVAVAVAAARLTPWWRVRRGRPAEQASPPRIPPGDLVALAAAVGPGLARAVRGVGGGIVQTRDRLAVRLSSVEARLRPGVGFAHLDVVLRRWRVAGVLFVVLGVAMVAALTWTV